MLCSPSTAATVPAPSPSPSMALSARAAAAAAAADDDDNDEDTSALPAAPATPSAIWGSLFGDLPDVSGGPLSLVRDNASADAVPPAPALSNVLFGPMRPAPSVETGPPSFPQWRRPSIAKNQQQAHHHHHLLHHQHHQHHRRPVSHVPVGAHQLGAHLDDEQLLHLYHSNLRVQHHSHLRHYAPGRHSPLNPLGLAPCSQAHELEPCCSSSLKSSSPTRTTARMPPPPSFSTALPHSPPPPLGLSESENIDPHNLSTDSDGGGSAPWLPPTSFEALQSQMACPAHRFMARVFYERLLASAGLATAATEGDPDPSCSSLTAPTPQLPSHRHSMHCADPTFIRHVCPGCSSAKLAAARLAPPPPPLHKRRSSASAMARRSSSAQRHPPPLRRATCAAAAVAAAAAGGELDSASAAILRRRLSSASSAAAAGAAYARPLAAAAAALSRASSTASSVSTTSALSSRSDTASVALAPFGATADDIDTSAAGEAPSSAWPAPYRAPRAAWPATSAFFAAAADDADDWPFARLGGGDWERTRSASDGASSLGGAQFDGSSVGGSDGGPWGAWQGMFDDLPNDDDGMAEDRAGALPQRPASPMALDERQPMPQRGPFPQPRPQQPPITAAVRPDDDAAALAALLDPIGIRTAANPVQRHHRPMPSPPPRVSSMRAPAAITTTTSTAKPAAPPSTPPPPPPPPVTSTPAPSRRFRPLLPMPADPQARPSPLAQPQPRPQPQLPPPQMPPTPPARAGRTAGRSSTRKRPATGAGAHPAVNSLDARAAGGPARGPNSVFATGKR